MVRLKGLEPTRIAAREPKGDVTLVNRLGVNIKGKINHSATQKFGISKDTVHIDAIDQKYKLFPQEITSQSRFLNFRQPFLKILANLRFDKIIFYFCDDETIRKKVP